MSPPTRLRLPDDQRTHHPMGSGVFTFDAIWRPGRREWVAIGLVVALMLLFLPMVVWKTIALGQGDVQVFFRAGWAIWTGYPLYEVADHHGWTYHYPPTVALFMGPFANPLPDHPQPWWALPYPVAVAVWYLINSLCLLLALHIWANALERFRPIEVRAGYLQRAWALRLGPLIALLPFIGDGLARGQPAPVLLFLIVLFLALYVENRVAAASFAFSLAITVKLFPLVLAVIPFLRRDCKFMVWTAGWCILLLLLLPAICLGVTATFDLYRTMFTEHLAGIISGAMSTKIASEVSPGGYSSIGVGAVVARLAAGQAFYSAPLPQWASAVQFLFNAAVVVAVVVLGRGGFWNCARRAAYFWLSAPRRRRRVVRGDIADDCVCRTAIRHVRRAADGRAVHRSVAAKRRGGHHRNDDRVDGRGVAFDDRA